MGGPCDHMHYLAEGGVPARHRPCIAGCLVGEFLSLWLRFTPLEVGCHCADCWPCVMGLKTET